MKFWNVTIIFFIGLISLLVFYFSMQLSVWYLVFWIAIFAAIQFCGAYFIGLNFHLPSVKSINTNQRQIVLTFDDGPHTHTLKVLEVLKRYQVKALFFIIGKNIKGKEWIMQQIVSEGHKIGNHSFSHHNWIDVWPTKKVTEDFNKCNLLLQKYQSTNLFRPPYGVTNPNIARAVKRLDLQSIGWTIRSYDTQIKDIEKIKDRVLSRLKPGAIILLHDRLAFMPDLLEALIPAIRERGYEMVLPEKF